MKTIDLTCGNCGVVFTKELREYKRQTKHGKNRFFCNSSCAAQKINTEVIRAGNPEFLIANNKRDEFTPFRWFVLRAQYRDRKKKYGCNVTVQYLKTLWEEQKGICPLSGWLLILPKDSDGCEKYLPNNASLDRIDNNQGYVQGNVRFISMIANFARSTFTDEQVKEFCRAVVNNDKIP